MPYAPPKHRHAGYQPRKAWQKATDHGRLTGRPWRRLRDQVFKRDRYLCVACWANGERVSEAKICDHRIPLSQGGTNDISNLDSLCVACSDAKSLAESHGGKTTAKRGTDADGWPADPAHHWRVE